MASEEIYLQFPLFLIRDFFYFKVEVINNILCFGAYRYSTRFSYELNDVARQIIYDYYNSKLSVKLMDCINAFDSEIIGQNEDYRGFVNGFFEPTEEIEEILSQLAWHRDFENMAIEHYQMHMALRALSMKGSVEHNLKIGKEIESKIPAREPMPMLSAKHLFDYRDKVKSESEMAQLLAFMALKSILGEKPYCKTNKKLIVARMFGYATYAKIPPVRPAFFEKYANRYHIDRVLWELRLNWQVNINGVRMRGFFISVGTKMGIDDLAEVAVKSKRENKINALKKKTTEATNRAIAKLNGDNRDNNTTAA